MLNNKVLRRTSPGLRKVLQGLSTKEIESIIYSLEEQNESLHKQLTTSPVGNIPNRIALQNTPKKEFIASIDIDSLKAINDEFRDHSAGDQLIRKTCEILQEECNETYHISGDEIVCQGDSLEDLRNDIIYASYRLQEEKIVRYNRESKTMMVQKGIGISMGFGKSKLEADEDLKNDKEQREINGLRSSRGERPIGFFTSTID